MNASDIIIGAVIIAVFALCVRSMVKSSKSGECVDCSHGGSCSGHETGHCEVSEDLVARAAKAASKVSDRR